MKLDLDFFLLCFSYWNILSVAMSVVTAYEGLSSDLGRVFQGLVEGCPRDITLQVGEEEMLVHMFILAARSKFFE